RHMDQHYRSLQFTARTLIVRRSPAGAVERFFFPFEVQIMDSVSHASNMVGKSNHAAYRERQREDARKRVFPWLRGSARVLAGRSDNASHGESTRAGEEPVP
ncbi:MAG: hypothetical protein FJZ00_05980, partial [Candidatus Sericytochromatia bacterium]|nr:hypothetical protein [Candidatus Tanganyikabacteria bacterium]